MPLERRPVAFVDLDEMANQSSLVSRRHNADCHKLLDASPVLNRMTDRADRIDTNQNGDAAARSFDILPIFVAMQMIRTAADRAFSESGPGRPAEFQPASRADTDNVGPEIEAPKRARDKFETKLVLSQHCVEPLALGGFRPHMSPLRRC